VPMGNQIVGRRRLAIVERRLARKNELLEL
jgi:hypothetical protein